MQQVWNLNLNRYSGTQLLKYEIAGHYQPHQDTGVDTGGRYFSIVCYLNYYFEGGRTLFPPLHHAVVPRAGLAAIFPSTYLHGSEPVVSGKKFVLVLWDRSHHPGRDRLQRTPTDRRRAGTAAAARATTAARAAW